MDDADRSRADSLLNAALELPAAERAAFLARECGDDEGLRRLVERLIRHAEEETTDDLATGAAIDAVAAEPDLVGTRVDRYHILRELGRGGMGVVYEARDEKLERSVALKMLSPTVLDDKVRERFLREARAAAALNHPHVVGIHDAGEDGGRPFLVMEFVDGTSLADAPPRNLDEALAIARQICDALEHAHGRNLVHRDLKPGNVLVTRNGQTVEAKLADLGIALARGQARVTRSGAITGTPTYMAPEQALGQEIDGRSDLYALGVLLYEWATGRPPFCGDDALAVVSQHIHAPVVPPRTLCDLPCGLDRLIVKLLAKEPADRFATAAEVREALGRVGSPETTAERRTEPDIAIDGLVRGRMVGREAELGQLQTLWSAAVEGRSHLALISGEPGVGKTRLAHEVTAIARLDGARVLFGGCYENEATTPYLPFVEAFRRWVGERDDEAIRSLLGDTVAELARLAPELESRLGPFPERPSLQPQEERLRLFDHFARFLRGSAAERGLLFFFDDLQWADHGSLSLLHYLMRQLAGARVLFLGTYREVELDRAHPLSQQLVDWNRERLASRIALKRLDREATGRMLETLLGQFEIPDDFVASLHRETEGNPFFVEEIVKALIADGGLVRAGHQWRRQQSGEVVLPQSVKAAIGRRLQRIDDACVEVLRTAAVVGKQFSFAELESTGVGGEDRLLDALDEAVAAQLVVARRDESFAFTHDKIREVLYEELNPIRRRRLHAKIAQGLERLHEGGDRVAVEDLAHHFVEGGDFERGLKYARAAAEAAVGVFAYDEALEMYHRARECAEALELSEDVIAIDERMGGAVFSSGDMLRAIEHYERALAATGDADRKNALRCKIGEAYVVSGDPRGREVIRRTLGALDPDRQPRVATAAMMVDARYRHLAGDLEQALDLYQRAETLLEPDDDPLLAVRLASFQSGTLQHMARFEASDAKARHCIELGERHDLPLGRLLGYEFLMENYTYRGWWRQAIGCGEQEARLAADVHAAERLAWSHFRGWALLPAGRLDEAQALLEQGIELCDRIGERRLKTFLVCVHAGCLTERGMFDLAIEQARQMTEESDEASLYAQRLCARSFLAFALMRSGQFAEAARYAREGVEMSIGKGTHGQSLLFLAGYAEALVRAGEIEGVEGILDEHAAIAGRTGAALRVGQNLRARGLLLRYQGRVDEASAILERSVAEIEPTGSPIELALSLVENASLRDELGRQDEAAADRRAAIGHLEACGASHDFIDRWRSRGTP